MNCDTGHIHQFANDATMKEFLANIPVHEQPVHGFVELGNAPVQGCDRCRGTGIKEITTSGRRIPCTCTNPK